MRAGRDEALDVVRKWLSEGALLQCNFDFRGFAAAFRGRIRTLSPDELRLLSDDKTSELVLTLGPDVEFGYGEPKASSEEADLAVCGLVVFLPPLGPDRDAIILTEFVEPS